MREWLKQSRLAKGLTQQQVADRLHITHRYYHYIERGGRNPHVELAKEIAKLLHCDWTLFFKDGEQDE